MTSRSANQVKTEPFPASATEAEAETPGSDHPQASGGLERSEGGDVGDAASVPTTSDQPASGTSQELPVDLNEHTGVDLDEDDTRS